MLLFEEIKVKSFSVFMCLFKLLFKTAHPQEQTIFSFRWSLSFSLLSCLYCLLYFFVYSLLSC